MSVRAIIGAIVVIAVGVGGYFAYEANQSSDDMAMSSSEMTSDGAMPAAHAGEFKAKSVDTTDYGNSPVLGDPNAPVTLLEFASMTCPHCAAFHNEKLTEIKKKYVETGMVKIVFKDFPFDQRAAGASMMARCVAPNRYFQAIDALFKTQNTWARSDDYLGELGKIAKLAGLSQEKFDACMKDDDILNQVLADRQEGTEKYKVDSTPTFFVNGTEKISGNVSLSDFEDVLNSYFE